MNALIAVAIFILVVWHLAHKIGLENLRARVEKLERGE